MEKYNETMLTIAMLLGGIIGFVRWISLIIDAANYDRVGWVILLFLLGEIIVPVMGILGGITWGLILYLVCLPFYAIYRLIWGNK